jgi:phage shock protein C
MSNNDSDTRELYRDPSRAKISGVCAGISDYFGLEVWVVRIIAVSALIFFQFPVLLAYGIAHFVLDPKPGSTRHNYRRHKGRGQTFSAEDETDTAEGAPQPEKATVQQVWKKGRIPGQTIRKVSKRFKHLEHRLQIMESYVTSRQFQLRKEFQDL